MDETGCNINLARRYGWAPKGERLVASIPRNTPKTLTLICALAAEGIVAALELDGAVDSIGFKLFVERCRVPVLQPGDVVVLDRLSAHCSDAATSPMEAVGSMVIILPGYSPDFNPIEQCFSKLKEFLRSVAPRTRRKLHNAVIKAMNSITPENVKGWFENAGYWVTPICEPLKVAIFDFIECFYNPQRSHSSIGYLSPIAFENQIN